MSKIIIIRNLFDWDNVMLDKLRKHFNTSANSKAMLKAAHAHGHLIEENKRLCEVSRNYHKLLKAIKAAKSADEEIYSLISEFGSSEAVPKKSDITLSGNSESGPKDRNAE